MSGELGRPSEKDLAIIIRRHEVWLESGAQRGERADISSMYLFRHDLSFRYMTKAICFDTDFSQANLTNTVFAGADLRGATFNARTILKNTNFVGATMDGTTNFSGADLRKAIVNARDFEKVNLLLVQRHKLPEELKALYDKQAIEHEIAPPPETEPQPDYATWRKDFEKSPRGRYGKGPGRH